MRLCSGKGTSSNSCAISKATRVTLITIFISRCSQEPIPDERGREVGALLFSNIIFRETISARSLGCDFFPRRLDLSGRPGKLLFSRQLRDRLSLRFLPLFRRASFLSLSLSFAAYRLMLRIIFHTGFCSLSFPLWESRLSLPLRLPLAGGGFAQSREDIRITPRSRFSSASTREEVLSMATVGAARRNRHHYDVSRTRVRRVHGEDHEDQEESAQGGGLSVRQLGQKGEAKRTGSTCSRTVAAVRRSNSSSSSATIFIFLSLSRAFRSLLPTTADDGIDRSL